jgi:dynein heavy chain
MASDLDLGKDLDNCVEVFKSIHMSVSKKSTEFADQLNRKNYVTPTSFLEQLAMYMQILKAKRIFVGQSKERLVKGLDVLGKAGIEIEKLEKQISDMAPVLAVTKAALAETMIVLAKEKADAAVE